MRHYLERILILRIQCEEAGIPNTLKHMNWSFSQHTYPSHAETFPITETKNASTL